MAVRLKIVFTPRSPGEWSDMFTVETEFDKFAIPVAATVYDASKYAQHAISSKFGMLPAPRGRVRVLQDAKATKTGSPKLTSHKPVPPDTSTMRTQRPDEHEVAVPVTEADWVVDPSRSLQQIKSMEADERLEFRRRQADPSAALEYHSNQQVEDPTSPKD
mmetsp:Transcript_17541/g.41738  ORF Transcript_17541/g.41738 Transcript_17541/m.41738 type:complete len:161 (-) Transcript_17541:45-527(-)